MLAQLDRQSQWRGVSPDRVGLVDLMRLYDVPAVSMAVRQDGAEPWTHAYGASPTDIFQACSISKHVAAFGALRLVDQGVLALDEDIEAYLMSWRLPESDGWRPTITLRQLLAHTAGLSYNWFRGFGQGEALPTITEVLRGHPPATSPPVRATMLPGSGFRYSGSHYAVLHQLLEDVTGTDFAELMRSLVLTIHAPGQPPLRLQTLSDGRLRATALDCELTVLDGAVLQLRQRDMTLTATRQES